MDHIPLCKVQQPREDILDDRLGALFREMVLPAEFGLEISTIADLGDDVAISIWGENFKTSQDVWVVKLLKDINFGEEKFLKFLWLERIEFYDLYGNSFVWNRKIKVLVI